MSDNKKRKILKQNKKNDLAKINHFLYEYDNDKFIEISSSLVYYLKLFSSLKRFLEYISLISKHLIELDYSLIMPLDDRGKIWIENIYFSDNSHYKELNTEINIFCKKSGLIDDFKIKNIYRLEQFFRQKFPSHTVKTHKVVSRGKTRGFLFTFHKEELVSDSFIQDRNTSFLVNLLAVGIENYLLSQINKKHENTDREISSGAEIQSRLLPDYCPKIYGVDLAAHCRPALQLGGDYYDFMAIKPNISESRRQKGRWALVIGDVMGKGIPAGLLMTMLRGMLRAEVLTGLPPSRILHDLNQLAIYDLDQSHRFITLFYSDYDPRTKKLRYANAAHNPPLLWRDSKEKIIRLDADGVVIGLQTNAEYSQGEIQLNSSDVILYYTDGITETINPSGEQFGEENLIESFSKLCKKDLNSQEILNSLFEILDEYSGINKKLLDDASLVIFKLE